MRTKNIWEIVNILFYGPYDNFFVFAKKYNKYGIVNRALILCYTWNRLNEVSKKRIKGFTQYECWT